MLITLGTTDKGSKKKKKQQQKQFPGKERGEAESLSVGNV